MLITADIGTLRSKTENAKIILTKVRDYNIYEEVVLLYVIQQLMNYLYEDSNHYIDNINLVTKYSLLKDEIIIDYNNINKLKSIMFNNINKEKYIVCLYSTLFLDENKTINVQFRLEDPESIPAGSIYESIKRIEWLFALDSFNNHFDKNKASFKIARDLYHNINNFIKTKDITHLKHIDYGQILSCIQTINCAETSRISTELGQF